MKYAHAQIKSYQLKSTSLANWAQSLVENISQPLSNSPQIDLFLIKGKDVKYMLETSVSGLCSDGSCYSNVLQLSGIRVTYRVTDTNSGNRIKERCTNTFWPLQNFRKNTSFQNLYFSLAKNLLNRINDSLSIYCEKSWKKP